MFQFINFKIINRFFYFIQLIIILLWCNISLASDLSNVTNLFKTQNNPPTELFGIKLFKNINEYLKVTVSFSQLDTVGLKTPYFYHDIRTHAFLNTPIKNSNFDLYTVYVNEKLEIVGIEGFADIPQDAFNSVGNSVYACLNIKTKLLVSIIELHNLNKENFKKKIYVNKSGIKNGVVLFSEFKFNNDGINLFYRLSCDSFLDDNDRWSSSLYIDLFTEKLANEYIKGMNLKESKKNLKQLLGITLIKDDIKGF